MYNRSKSPQVRYSLESLTKSFFYFMQTQKMDEISITQICEKAGLTRRTFYRNCENRQDLILYAWAEDEFRADEKALTESILFLAPVQQKAWDGIPKKTLHGA